MRDEGSRALANASQALRHGCTMHPPRTAALADHARNSGSVPSAGTRHAPGSAIRHAARRDAPRPHVPTARPCPIRLADRARQASRRHLPRRVHPCPVTDVADFHRTTHCHRVRGRSFIAHLSGRCRVGGQCVVGRSEPVPSTAPTVAGIVSGANSGGGVQPSDRCRLAALAPPLP
jgi:hypothetical protein